MFNAREYLSRAIAWPQPGEAPAYVNIHWSTVNKNAGQPNQPDKWWTGRACQTLDEAVNAVAFALKGGDTLDIYACQSTQAFFEEKTSTRGFKYRKAVRSSRGAVAMKGFFLDVDAKPGDLKKGYATIDEAVVALGEFLNATKLPRPTMFVATGGGLHVYWLVDRALSVAEWEPTAFALAEATKRHGLRCDTQCTVDAARILRVPDTFNKKTQPARAVRFGGSRLNFDYRLEQIADVLKPYEVAMPSRIASPSLALFPARPPVLENALAGGIDTSNYDPVVLDTVLPECPFLMDAVVTGGALLGNPLWNLTTLIATFCVDGRAQAHRMGKGHPDYDVTKQDEFFDRKSSEAAERGLGWPSCRTISGNGSIHCQHCPHFVENKSPLNFRAQQAVGGVGNNSGAPTATAGQAAPAAPVTVSSGFGPISSGQPQAPVTLALASVAATPVINLQLLQIDMPKGYMRNASGIVSKAIVDEQGNTSYVPISDYPMTDAWLQKGPKMLHFKSTVERGRIDQISIDLEHVNTNEMRRILQAQGFMLNVKNTDTAEFFVSWIKKLQEHADAVTSSPFGWTTKGGKVEGFVYGGSMFTPVGSKQAANADPTIAAQYSPNGDIQPWLDCLKLVTSQGRMDLDAIVVSAFAAPLVHFTGQPGLLMSVYSQESGIGKSTALKVAQAVWGNPRTGIQSLDDTQNSVMNKLGSLRSLPLYWDELKTEDDTKKFVTMTFKISLGKEKSRLRANTTQREPGDWETLVVSASNDSLLNYVTERTNTTTAGIMRIFEYVVEKAPANAPGQINQSDAGIMVSKLNRNYGQVGLAYAKYLGEHYDQIAADMKQFQADLTVEVQGGQDERFWIALLSTLLLGARYANTLGFGSFNEAQLKDFLLAGLSKMRGERTTQPVDMSKDINVSSVLGRYFGASRKRHTLVTNRIHVSRGKPPAGMIKILNADQGASLEGVHVHIGHDDKLVRINSAAFSEWLSEKQISRHVFKAALEKEFKMKHVTGRIGGGTVFAGPTEYLMEIDLAGSSLLNFIDEA